MFRPRRPDTALVDLENIHQVSGVKTMTKERKSNREGKKKPAMTPKEKKAAKRARREYKDPLGLDKAK